MPAVSTFLTAGLIAAQGISTGVEANQARIARERTADATKRAEQRQDKLLEEERSRQTRAEGRQASANARSAQRRQAAQTREESGGSRRSTIATTPLGSLSDSQVVGKTLLGL